MKRYLSASILVGLLILAIAYAMNRGIGVLHVLSTADVGWHVSPSWNLPLMFWGILLNAAGVLLELMPYFLLGVLLGGFLAEFVSRSAIERHMGHGGPRSIAIATIAGGVVPICSCGIVPVLAGLVQAGLPLAPVVAFLISAPMLNPATVAMTVGMLGWPIAIARILAVFCIALVTGFIVKNLLEREWLSNPIKAHVPPRLSKEQHALLMQVGIELANHSYGLTSTQLRELMGRDVETDLCVFRELGLMFQNSEEWKLADRGAADASAQNACFVLGDGEQAADSAMHRVGRAFVLAWSSLLGLAKYILLAVAIAGAIKVLLPAELIAQWLGGVSINSVFVAALIAIPMYVCTCSDVPMVTALVTKGMGGGAALAFLLGGPGLSIPSLAMLSGVFKPRLLLVYAVVSLVGCIMAGTAYNLFF